MCQMGMGIGWYEGSGKSQKETHDGSHRWFTEDLTCFVCGEDVGEAGDGVQWEIVVSVSITLFVVAVAVGVGSRCHDDGW